MQSVSSTCRGEQQTFTPFFRRWGRGGAVCDRTNLFARVFDSGHSFVRPSSVHCFLPSFLLDRLGFLSASFGRARAARRMRAVLKRSANGVNARISGDRTGLSAPFRNVPRLLRPFNARFENRVFACRPFEFRGNEIVVRLCLLSFRNIFKTYSIFSNPRSNPRFRCKNSRFSISKEQLLVSTINFRESHYSLRLIFKKVSFQKTGVKQYTAIYFKFIIRLFVNRRYITITRRQAEL